MNPLKKAFRRAMRVAAGSPGARELVRIFQEEASQLQGEQGPSLAVVDTFTDSRGETFERLDGLRDTIKPSWRLQLQEGEDAHLPSEADIRAGVAPASKSVHESLSMLESLGFSVKGKNVLEIGCYDGHRAEVLARSGAACITAGDITEYFVMQKSGVDADAEKQQSQFDWIREQVAAAHREVGGARASGVDLKFIEDDMTQSVLDDHSFDAVFSWEVLEHIPDNQAALNEMARILKPGGYGFHDYNPFFAYNGGHSLCTLDFRWGHARLLDTDFEKYVETFRPEEKHLALQFYRENLNRMTHQDLLSYAEKAGLECLAFVPWFERRLLKWIDDDVVRQVTSIYPTATVQDLLARNVWLVFRKPE